MKFKLLKEKEKQKIMNFFHSRFGVSKDFFKQFAFLQFNKFVWISSIESVKTLYQAWQPKAIGLLLLVDSKKIVPSFYAMTFLGKQISQNFIELNAEQVEKFFSNKTFSVKGISLDNVLSEGIIAIKFEQQVIGSAFFEKQSFKPNLPIKKNFFKIGLEL